MVILTDKLCKSLPAPERGNRLFRDEKDRGLALRVTAAGNRAFVFAYSAGNRERRMTIGEYGAWSLGAARQRAKELRREVNLGNDPLAVRDEARRATTLSEAWAQYLETETSSLAPRTLENYRHAWEKQILPALGPNMPLRDLNRDHVQRLMSTVRKAAGPTAANRMHATLRKVLNVAVANNALDSNPAAANIQRYREQPRERYLSGAELENILAAIAALSGYQAATAIKFMLLTGARKSEILSMRWSQLDIEEGSWSKPPTSTKQRRAHKVPLDESILVELRAMQDTRENSSDFVFPSDSSSGHLTDVKYTWRKVLRMSGVKDCRLHDLRHTFASVMIGSGVDLYMVGKLLGHSEPRTTARYAHLEQETMREALAKGFSRLPRDSTDDSSDLQTV